MASGTIAFLLGVVTLQWLPALPPPVWAAGIPLFPLVWFLSRKHQGIYSRRVLALLALAALGFAWAWVRASVVLAEALSAEREGTDLMIVGTVQGLPERDGRRLRFEFDPQTITANGTPVDFAGRLRLSWYDDAPPMGTGERWQLIVRLKRPHGMSNPGGFDNERWLYQHGIRATGYVRADPLNRRLDPAGWNAPVDRVREFLRVQQLGPLGDSQSAGLVVALTIGEFEGISPEQWDVFTATGTNHLMAISGLHVGMVGSFAALIVLRLWRVPRLLLEFPAPKAAAWAAVGAALAYSLLAGMSVPTQRSLAMIAVVAAAVVWGRAWRPSAVLAASLCAVLLLDPLAVLAPGFWLSFGAVALILYAMGGRWAARGLWWRWGRVQVVVAVGLLPFLASFFGNASLSSPVANVIAIPWVGLVVVPLALAGTAFSGFLPAVGEPLLTAAALLLDWLWPLLKGLAELAPAAQFAARPGWIVAASMLGVLWMLAPRGWPARAVGALWLLPLVFWQPPRPENGEAWLTLLDVGQGLATVVETAHHTMVYDTGPRLGPDFDTGSAVVAPFLRTRGIQTLDMLIVSHGDNDHIGGARSLTDAWPPSRTLTGVPDKMDWIHTETCRRGQSWAWDGVRFEVLHPLTAAGGNDGSCVVRVETTSGAFLLTGDIEARAEQEMLAAGVCLHARVLVIPHHGSKTSSTEDFIHAVAPEVALLPVGYRNRYRLPNGMVMQRYDDYAVWTHASAEDGAVTAKLGQDGELRVSTHRELARRYFHWQH